MKKLLEKVWKQENLSGRIYLKLMIDGIVSFVASGSVKKKFSVDYVSFVNIFFNRFCPVEKCGVTPHCFYQDLLT